jgi:signal transduction histidine kinase/ligand-binding sensor domain-containing protein
MAAAAAVLLAALAAPAAAQRLPVTTFTRVNGLSHEYIFDILTDSRGFVWLTTQDGVNRFDGARFIQYNRRDGVPDRAVNSVLETRDGTIWIATNGNGVARFEPRGVGDVEPPQFFTTFRVGPDRRSNRVNRLVEDEAGTLWAATDGGLFRMAAGQRDFERVTLSQLGIPDDVYVSDLLPGQNGELWLATTADLFRRLADGRGSRYVVTLDPQRRFVRRVIADRDGVIWATGTGGVLAIARPPVGSLVPTSTDIPVACRRRADGTLVMPASLGASCHVGVAQGLSNDRPISVGLGQDGRLLLGHAAGGLTEIVRGRVSVIEPANEEFDVSALAFDRAGNLWIGTQAGAKRVLRGGFVTFSTYDGLAMHNVRRVQLGPDRNVLISTYDLTLHWFDNGELRQVRFPLGPNVVRPTWGGASDYRAPTGEWWVPTRDGLYRFAGVPRLEMLANARPLGVYTTRDGLASNDISQLLMDSRGDLWVGHASAGGPAVSRRSAATGRFAVVPIVDLPQITTVVSFAEDRSGQIWLGLRDGGVARFRDGKFVGVPGLPPSPGSILVTDSRGQLWLSKPDAFLRIEDPHAEVVTVQPLGGPNGMDKHALSMVEDLHGRMYLGTLTGVMQFEADRQTSRHYTPADGLPSSNVVSSVRDGRGDLWFGTTRGVARLRPSEQVLLPPGPARISSVQIGNRRVRVSEFGELEVTGLSAGPNQNNLHIEFFALGGGTLPTRYQYRIAPDEPWSTPSESRSVELAGLSAGRYAFEVRAVDPATGAVVPGRAAVAFRILPPLWQRWWFLLLAGLAAVGAGYVAHRSRLAGALRLERIRARIATDLHDDIGSSLSQISILSEVSRQRIRNDPATAHEPLGLIAETSRELVDKMADIVWAVNPRRDSLSDLVYRMRRFADDTFGAADIRFRFTAPESLDGIRLGPDVRRELLLILKESVTNIAKHSRATEAAVDLAVDGGRLLLTIRDNGRGFDPEGQFDGNGVQSMRTRVQALGGTLRIHSAPETGTTVAMTVET